MQRGPKESLPAVSTVQCKSFLKPLCLQVNQASWEMATISTGELIWVAAVLARPFPLFLQLMKGVGGVERSKSSVRQLTPALYLFGEQTDGAKSTQVELSHLLKCANKARLLCQLSEVITAAHSDFSFLL